MTSGDAPPPTQGGPKGPIKDTMRAPLPRRFYKTADIRRAEDSLGFEVVLDGRRMRTPGKRAVVLPTERLAQLVCDEWTAQTDLIDPATMPVTRIVNSAIDGVAGAMDEVASDLVAYAGSDLLCYRAEGPAELVARQDEAWTPILGVIEKDLDVCFRSVAGVMPVDQPDVVRARMLATLAGLDAFALAGLHVITTLTGSAVLAVAVLRWRITPEAAWAAAHVDEDWQIELWGADAEADNRRRLRRAEFEAACNVVMAVR